MNKKRHNSYNRHYLARVKCEIKTSTKLETSGPIQTPH